MEALLRPKGVVRSIAAHRDVSNPLSMAKSWSGFAAQNEVTKEQWRMLELDGNTLRALMAAVEVLGRDAALAPADEDFDDLDPDSDLKIS